MQVVVCLALFGLFIFGEVALLAWLDVREEAWRRGECGGGGARWRRCKTLTGGTEGSDFPGRSAEDGRAPVAADFVGRAFQEGRVFVEVLPRGFADVVRKPLQEIADGGGAVEDAGGYESLHDAIVEAKGVGTRLLEHVVAENLLFVFGESTEALKDALCFAAAAEAAPDGAEEGQGFGDGRHGKPAQEDKSKNAAVVVCKVKKSAGVQEGRRGEKEDGGQKGGCRKATWGELEALEEECERGCHGADCGTEPTAAQTETNPFPGAHGARRGEN